MTIELPHSAMVCPHFTVGGAELDRTVIIFADIVATRYENSAGAKVTPDSSRHRF